MKFHQLEISSKKDRKRVGRGISAGGGKTAGRGTKGQNSRSGGRVRPGFEGGQNPIIARLPKLPGFTSHRPVVQVVTTGQLDKLNEKDIDNYVLKNHGLVKNASASVKVVNNGDLNRAVNVRLQAVTASAESIITKAGGSFEKTSKPTKAKKDNPKGKKRNMQRPQTSVK